MRRFIGLTILVLLVTSATNAQKPAKPVSDSTSKLIEAPPESVKMSTARLARIDNVVKQYIDKGRIPGAVGLIARNGKIVYYRALGFDNKEEKTPLKRSAIYRIASQTKAITSVAVMMLYEEGKFLLDDPISKYLFSFKNAQVLDKFNPADSTYTTVPAKRQVTIRDLLTHTSGIGYAQIGTKENNAIYGKHHIVAGFGPSKKVLGEDIQKLGALPLLHNPGEKWTYGLNDDVLGYLVEVVSGMSLDKFFRTRIFDPLGMNDTYFYLPPAKHNRLVTLYVGDSTGALHKAPAVIDQNGPIETDYPKMEGTYFSGGAGLSSTVYDYAIFLQMLLNDGQYDGKRILSRNSVRMMTMNQIGEGLFGHNEFGLGFGIVSHRGSADSPRQEGTYEWGGAFSTGYWVDPKEKLVCLFFNQLWDADTDGLGDKFKVLVYQALND